VLRSLFSFSSLPTDKTKRRFPFFLSLHKRVLFYPSSPPIIILHLTAIPILAAAAAAAAAAPFPPLPLPASPPHSFKPRVTFCKCQLTIKSSHVKF